MAVSITHQFVSAIADGADTSLVRPSDWNATHSLAGLGTGVETALGVNVGSAGAFTPNNSANTFTASQTFSAATSSIYLGANSGNLGVATFYGSTSGSVTVKPAAAAGTGTVFQLPASNGTSGYFLQTDGAGVTSWAAASASPGGSNTQVQYNSSGSFAGSAALTFNGSHLTCTGYFIGSSGFIKTDYTLAATAFSGGYGFVAGSAGALGWSSAADAVNNAPDTRLYRVAAGITGVRGNASTTGGALSFIEQTAPSAPATNGVYIYAEDNGSGKTRLMALFPTGAAQQIAIEP